MKYLIIALSMIFIPVLASSKIITTSNGTGFFVSSRYIVTNNHVVSNCREIYVRGDQSIRYGLPVTKAKKYGADYRQDLALLSIEKPYRKYTILREDDGIREGDKVLVIGYPEEHSVSGQYRVVESSITKVQGSFGDESSIEFTDSVRQGNSGGPLFDLYGNVVGVIVGYKEYYTYDIRTPEDKQLEKRVGAAIPLNPLKNFLIRFKVPYLTSRNPGDFPSSYIESIVKNTIVNIQCIH